MEEDRLNKFRDKIITIFERGDMDSFERYETVINRMNLTPDQVADIFNFMLFDELEFNDHEFIDGAVQCYLEFVNGNYISVIGGGDEGFLYGNGRTTFEIKSTMTDKTEEGILGYQTIDKLNHHLILLQI